MVYTVIGPTTLAAFFVYAFVRALGLIGSTAPSKALPEGDHRRYALPDLQVLN